MYEFSKSSAYPRIELLDSSHGRPIQSWDCSEFHKITIGRLSTQHICIPDTYVSREHAEIVPVEGGWELRALGRHGVILDGTTIETTLMKGETIFRLGVSGPMLKFIGYPPIIAEADDTFMPIDALNTTQIDVLELEDLETQDRDAQVNEIANSDFFRLLKEKADRIRVNNP